MLLTQRESYFPSSCQHLGIDRNKKKKDCLSQLSTAGGKTAWLLCVICQLISIYSLRFYSELFRRVRSRGVHWRIIVKTESENVFFLNPTDPLANVSIGGHFLSVVFSPQL